MDVVKPQASIAKGNQRSFTSPKSVDVWGELLYVLSHVLVCVLEMK